MLRDGITDHLCGSTVCWNNNNLRNNQNALFKYLKILISHSPPNYDTMHIQMFPPRCCGCRNPSGNIFSPSLTRRSAGAEGIRQLSVKVKVTTTQPFYPRSSQSVKTHTASPDTLVFSASCAEREGSGCILPFFTVKN